MLTALFLKIEEKLATLERDVNRQGEQLTQLSLDLRATRSFAQITAKGANKPNNPKDENILKDKQVSPSVSCSSKIVNINNTTKAGTHESSKQNMKISAKNQNIYVDNGNSLSVSSEPNRYTKTSTDRTEKASDLLFTKVERRGPRNKHKQLFVEGKGEETSNSLQAVEKTAWIYVTRLNQSTTEKQIVDHLSRVCKVSCTKLELKNRDRVASFRIGVPFDRKDSIMDGAIWPRGTLLNRYFFPKNRGSQSETKLSDVSADDFLNQTIIETSLK